MEIKKSIIINRPAAAVWEVLGTQFGAAYKWASGLNHSESYGKPELEDAHCNNRSCELPTGNIKEVIRTFDTKNYALAYEVLEGFPFFVDKGINHWKLTERDGKTEVHMHLKITTKGLVGKLMGPMMKLQMNGLTSTVIQDLKHYVETGQPSPNKLKEIKKYRAKAATS